MSSRTPHAAVVRERRQLSDHLVRLVLETDGSLATTGLPDEWLALTVPGQFQTRYYTVRRLEGRELVLDVVVHDEGLVTAWAARHDCVGDTVGLGAPKGSFEPPDDAGWVVLAGDLTALPAMARIAEHLAATRPDLPLQLHAESPDGPLEDYLAAPTTWHHADPGSSDLARVVAGLDWPAGPGYFWMAGESAQMREIRRHVRRDLGQDTRHHDVMGYWSGSRGRQARRVDPPPAYASWTSTTTRTTTSEDTA
ncbi:siderophore-interacting protein [Nocardioides scoriae]|uniref:siderophore-interacting protein n=1 Tax=Nocardioides scoriae TaxID=642780 RepID=UPI0012F93439|nr:siderophore-interacting protein [Nocardioides scoriae]